METIDHSKNEASPKSQMTKIVVKLQNNMITFINKNKQQYE